VLSNISIEQSIVHGTTQKMPILIPVSWGELLDKITILDIKLQRIENAAKLENVQKERNALLATLATHPTLPPAAEALVKELRTINEKLWDIEDELRTLERAKDFGGRFVSLARGVYHNNDQRSDVKKRINTLLGSELFEEKSYQPY
jgi:hypothetical protein